jgi:ATP-dependent Clp protease adapter protein ClpS
MTLRFDPGLKALLDASLIEATRRRHAAVTIEHFVLAATRDLTAGALFRIAGADAAEIGREIADYLELIEALPANGYRPPRTGPLLERAIRRAAAHAQSAQRPDVRAGDVLASIVRETGSYAAITLGAAGVGRLDVLRAVAHGRRDCPLPSSLAVDGRARVVLHNDDFTTMEFVTAVLEEVFELPKPEAARLMLHVHRQGATTVGAFTVDEALARARRTLRLAEEAEFPLRVTVEV